MYVLSDGLRLVPRREQVPDSQITATIIAALESQLTRVVGVELAISESYLAAFLDILRRPVPNLRHLGLTMLFFSNENDFSSYQTLDLRPLRSSVLTSLTLGNVRLQAGTSASGTTRLDLTYNALIPGHAYLSVDFPDLKVLGVDGLGISDRDGALHVHFTDLTLDR